jgi:DedD protein
LNESPQRFLLVFKSGKEGRSDRNESIETIRRQAQHRLVGTAILVTIAVISFSLLFDTAPRSLPVDMPIAIPAKDKVAPITPVPMTSVVEAKRALDDNAGGDETPKPAAINNTVAAVSAEADDDRPDEDSTAAAAEQAKQLAAEKVTAEKLAAEKLAAEKLAANKAAADKAATDKATADKAAAQKADTQRAERILNDKPKAANKLDYPDDGKRRVIQVGAFTENRLARALRLKLEAAGITTLVNVATVNGERMIRIRVGPFTDARELQTYIDRIKSMGLEARVLTY